MSEMLSCPPLPNDILQTIVESLADADDEALSSVKTCSLVSKTFLHLCRKHIFATIILDGRRRVPPLPNTRHLIRLLSDAPEIASYFRNLDCHLSADDLAQASLPEVLMLISKLNRLTLSWPPYMYRWDSNPLRPALLHLLHLPTLVHLRLSAFRDLLVSDLVACSGLKKLELDDCTAMEPSGTALPSFKPIPLQHLSVASSSLQMTSVLCKMQHLDGKPIIDFSSLSTISLELSVLDVNSNVQDLLRRCDQITYLHMFLWTPPLTWRGLHDMLYPSMRTMRHLDLETMLNDETGSADPLSGLIPELEEMSSRNRVESIAIKVYVQTDLDCHRGDLWGALDKTLAGSSTGWPELRYVSLKITIWSFYREDDELEVALRKLPETQFPLLSSNKVIGFQYSVANELA